MYLSYKNYLQTIVFMITLFIRHKNKILLFIWFLTKNLYYLSKLAQIT